MAYYADDEEQQGGQTGSGAVTRPGSGLVSGAASGAPGGGKSAPAEAAKQTTPGNSASPFVGIKEYLNANKQQSGKLGGQVGNFVGGRVDAANEALKGAEQNFGQQVDQNTVKLDENLLNQIKNDPTKVAQNQAQLQQAKNMQKAYAGPTDFQTNQAYQSAAPTLQKAQNTVSNLGNAQGQKQVLTEQQLENRGGKVNRGAATLDQALLQASPEAREALKPTQEKGAQLKGNIDTTIQNAMQRVSGAQAQSAATNKAVQDFYNQQYQQQQAALNARAQAANQAAQQEAQDIRGRVGYGQLSDRDLAYLGLSRGDFDTIRGDFAKYGPEVTGGYGNQGMDQLMNYVGFSNPNATAQNVATAEDYARAQALNQLAGFGGEYLSNPSLANTFNSDTVNFDVAGARNFINERKAAAERLAAQQAQGGGTGGGFANQVNESVNGGPLAPVVNTVKSVFPSDKNLKTDIKPFEAKKFLETISKGRKAGDKHGSL